MTTKKKKTTSRRAKRKTSERRQPAGYVASEWDETSTVEVTPEPRMKSGMSTSIRLPTAMVKKLRRIAERKGDIGYQTLIKIWIAERLEEELKRAAG